MRVTIVIGSLGGGGAERVCVNLANAWAGSGRAVTILTRGPSAYALDPRVSLLPFDDAPVSLRSLAPIIRVLRADRCWNLLLQAGPIALLRDAILATEPDVVVSHLTMTNLRVLAALQETGVPVIACEHPDGPPVPPGGWAGGRGVTGTPGE